MAQASATVEEEKSNDLVLPNGIHMENVVKLEHTRDPHSRRVLRRRTNMMSSSDVMSESGKDSIYNAERLGSEELDDIPLEPLNCRDDVLLRTRMEEDESKIGCPGTSLHDRNLSADHEARPYIKGKHKLFLNDVYCFPRPNVKQALADDVKSFASDRSSINTPFTPSWCAVFPLEPTHQPPVRCPTPPGLASFGTVEAQRYRLVLAADLDPLVAFLRRLFGCDPGQIQGIQRSMSAQPADQWRSHSDQPQPQPSSPPAAMLRRALGGSHIVNSPPQSESNPRSKLPPWIRVSSMPGPLAEAADGSYVLGFLPLRSSDHRINCHRLDTRSIPRPSTSETLGDVLKQCQMLLENEDHRETRASRNNRVDNPVMPEPNAYTNPYTGPPLSTTWNNASAGGAGGHPEHHEHQSRQNESMDDGRWVNCWTVCHPGRLSGFIRHTRWMLKDFRRSVRYSFNC